MTRQYTWRARLCGKQEYYTPVNDPYLDASRVGADNEQEQFTEEWDFVPGAPYWRDEPTAGNYHWWTNMYQAAHVSNSSQPQATVRRH